MSIKRTFAVIPFFIMSSISGVYAEVKLDGTLGTETHGNIAGPDYAIEAAMGKQQGASLFHSFEKFNVGSGESAVFRGPADVERIISRVTGGSASNIDGLIKSEIQGADFYFINPFGMIFGPNASLDITGSFYATSADYLKLGENGRFDARNPEKTVLTADAPEAFGFLGQKPGDITVQARSGAGTDAATGTPEYSGLEVNGDSRIMLAGGDIKIDNGIVQTQAGNLDVAAVSSAGELDIESPDARDFESLGKIEAVNEGHIYSKGGGNIKCQADSVEVFSNSSIETLAHTGIPKAGDVTVNARDSVTVSGSGGGFASGIGSIVNNIPDTGSGNVLINTEKLNVSDGAVVYSASINSGNTSGGSISIKAPEVVLEKRGCLLTQTSNVGSAGDIILDVARLKLLEGGWISASITGGSGKAGNIDIKASESVYASGFWQNVDNIYLSGVFSGANGSENASGGSISIKAPEVVIEKRGCLSTESQNSGNAGDLILDVARLKLLEGGWISASITGGSGKAGDIDIEASESVSVTGYLKNMDTVYASYISSTLNDSKSDERAFISIRTPLMELTNGGYIAASIWGGEGVAGIIDINASNRLKLSGYVENKRSCIASSAYDSLSAKAGNINIVASEINIENNAFLATFSRGSGGANNIDIITDCLNISEGGTICASIDNNSVGKGGSININAAESINIVNYREDGTVSRIYTDNVNAPDAEGGNISIKAPEINIAGVGSGVSCSSRNSASSGNIILDVARLKLLDGGLISASIDGGNGNAGNIDIKASESVYVSGFWQNGDSIYKSYISSGLMNSENISGGSISINAPEIVIENRGSLLTESSNAGDAGDIILDVARLKLLDGGWISASISGGSGKAGDIDIKASESVYVSGFWQNADNIYSSCIESGSYDSENASGGSISINTQEALLENIGGLSTSSSNAGDAGDIILDVARLKLLDGGWISASIDGGSGKAGDINIKAFESISISGLWQNGDNTYISSVISESKNLVNSSVPSIFITTPDLIVEKKGGISLQSVDSCSSGDIYLEVYRLKLVNGIINSSIIRGNGKAGDIYANVNSLDVLDGSNIASSVVSGTGKAGAININASDYIIVSGESDSSQSMIAARVRESANAEGGTIELNTPELEIADNGLVSAESQNSGDSGRILCDLERLSILNGGGILTSVRGGNGESGSIIVSVSDSVVISGSKGDIYSRIDSNSENSESEFGGNISIFSPETIISDGGYISCSSLNAGTAGDIAIEGSRFLNYSGSVNTTADSSGGGNIFFNINDLFFMNNGSVTTAVSGGEGSGGSIYIEKPELAVLRESRINASAKGGNGGDINISSDYFIKDISSSLDASSELGVDGRINIDSPDVDLNNGLIRLTGEYNDLTRFLHNPCLDRMLGKISTLKVGPGIVKKKNPFAYFEIEN